MSELFPIRPLGGPPDPEGTLHLDPLLRKEHAVRRWQVRAAQWRAVELAEALFGPGVRARLSGPSRGGAFRGLLHLDVPFEGLESHRRREAAFTAAAGRDPVLGRVPLIFVFGALAGDGVP